MLLHHRRARADVPRLLDGLPLLREGRAPQGAAEATQETWQARDRSEGIGRQFRFIIFIKMKSGTAPPRR